MLRVFVLLLDDGDLVAEHVVRNGGAVRGVLAAAAAVLAAAVGLVARATPGQVRHALGSLQVPHVVRALVELAAVAGAP